ncbi:TetR/AcrR family transcriptional regulator [Loktanella sp. Alg231-35]|uniref:TetR/AcrR family transcriptional regulator n=1 Tax=Loktanella sp. Alg231-35 TaxID=1922220 RepID=UPI000D553D93|nr:TetR/AcrR family transcriptional regulator [Loktanella sp. Alg231-35]
MPRSTKEQTGKKLRDAVVAEAVENGIGTVGVSAVVARAKVSAGTVYVHYQNKDDMLARVYMDLKAELHARITDGLETTNTTELIREMWFNMFAFVSERPRDFLFLEYCSTAKLLNPDQQRVVDGYTEDIGDVLQRGIDDGTLAPLDRRLLTLMLIAPAERLARRAVLSGENIPTETIEQIFDRVWLSISNSA